MNYEPVMQVAEVVWGTRVPCRGFQPRNGFLQNESKWYHQYRHHIITAATTTTTSTVSIIIMAE